MDGQDRRRGAQAEGGQGSRQGRQRQRRQAARNGRQEAGDRRVGGGAGQAGAPRRGGAQNAHRRRLRHLAGAAHLAHGRTDARGEPGLQRRGPGSAREGEAGSQEWQQRLRQAEDVGPLLARVRRDDSGRGGEGSGGHGVGRSSSSRSEVLRGGDLEAQGARGDVGSDRVLQGEAPERQEQGRRGASEGAVPHLPRARPGEADHCGHQDRAGRPEG
ncbi:unnamed protein product, partial [Prorocentrum cordatum]